MCELRVASVNFEREKIFPFRATDVQPRGLAFGRAQTQKGIVVHRHLPEIGCRVAFNFFEIAQKPARQINQMNSLVNQLAAAGKFRIGAPFLVVTDAPAMAVTRANETSIRPSRRIKNLPRLEKGRMITMIETDADTNAMIIRERNQFVNLLNGNAGRFFHEDVFAGANRGGGNVGQRGVDGGNNHRVHLRIGDGLFEIGNRATGFGQFYQFFGARQGWCRTPRRVLNRRAIRPAVSFQSIRSR